MNKITETQTKLENNLKIHLDLSLNNHQVKEVYNYSVIPAGKMFRPWIVWSIANDLMSDSEKEKKSFETFSNSNSHALLASAIELHHTYTLIHDDLPAMDDDDFRRGRKSCHKMFNEWQAILAGDGLLNASYSLLSKLNTTNLANILKFFSWALGPKGLIHGQVLDLSEEMKNSFDNILLTHELKTSRLIQVAMISSFLLIEDTDHHKKNQFDTSKSLFRLGKSMGIVFQLLDDLTEIAEENLSLHENEINPWFYYHQETNDALIKHIKVILKMSNELELRNFQVILKNYFQKTTSLLNSGEKYLELHFLQKEIEFNLRPIMALLN